MKTQLKNRTLWFDGTNQVAPDIVPSLLLEGVPIEKIVVTENSADVVQYNALSEVPMETHKEKNAPFNMAYQIPSEFSQMDFDKYVNGKFVGWAVFQRDLQPEGFAKYESRMKAELEEIRLRGIEMFFKTLAYVISELKKSDTVWGVGRGSSCASLVLFLMGLHKVDPVKYNIPMTEFFHD